jgi:hypothetical protein
VVRLYTSTVSAVSVGLSHQPVCFNFKKARFSKG